MGEHILLVKLVDGSGQVVDKREQDFTHTAEFDNLALRLRSYSHPIAELIVEAESRFQLPRKYSIVMEVTQR